MGGDDESDKRDIDPKTNKKQSTTIITEMVEQKSNQAPIQDSARSDQTGQSAVESQAHASKVEQSEIQRDSIVPFPEAYSHRDILGLKPLSKWTNQDKQVHIRHNRILQPRFMNRDAMDVLRDAKLSGVEWLTDICCPSVPVALFLHIGKELVVNYKVKDSDLNMKAAEVYQSLLAADGGLLQRIEREMDDEIAQIKQPTGILDETTLKSKAMEMISKNKIVVLGETQIKAAMRITEDIEIKKCLYEKVSHLVRDYLHSKSEELDLNEKTEHSLGTNRDYCFLGAAGSGKSTLSRHYFNDEEKTDYIILATDNYRAFFVPGTESHEAGLTKDIFIRTQDMAYMIKDLVQEALNSKMKITHSRPNVICDCITLDENMRLLLNQASNPTQIISVVAAYRGEPGYLGIAERADHRARDVNAAPADKGRFFETTQLLKGHADASARLLSSVPSNVVTTVYDTNVERGVAPVVIARIDSPQHRVEITNLRVLSEFLNKRNINSGAVNVIELILSGSKSQQFTMLATHPENKAKSIIDLVSQTSYKPAYTVELKDADGKMYAKLTPDQNNKVQLIILEPDLFLALANQDGIEASVLRAIARQVETGGANESLEIAFKAGNNDYQAGDKISFQELEINKPKNPAFRINK